MCRDLVKEFQRSLIERKEHLPLGIKAYIEQLLFFKNDDDLTWVDRETARSSGNVPVNDVTMWRYTLSLIALGILELVEPARRGRSPLYKINVEKAMGITRKAILDVNKEHNICGRSNGKRAVSANVVKENVEKPVQSNRLGGVQHGAARFDTSVKPNITNMDVKSNLYSEGSVYRVVFNTMMNVISDAARFSPLTPEGFADAVAKMVISGLNPVTCEVQEKNVLDLENIGGITESFDGITGLIESDFNMCPHILYNYNNDNTNSNLAPLAGETAEPFLSLAEDVVAKPQPLLESDERKNENIGEPPTLHNNEQAEVAEEVVVVASKSNVSASTMYVPCDSDGYPIKTRGRAAPKKKIDRWAVKHRDVMDLIASMRSDRPAVFEALYPGASVQTNDQVWERVIQRAKDFCRKSLYQLTGEVETEKTIINSQKLVAQYNNEEIVLIKKWLSKQGWVKYMCSTLFLSAGGRGVAARYNYLVSSGEKPKDDYQRAMMIYFCPQYEEKLNILEITSDPKLLAEHQKRKEEEYLKSDEYIQMQAKKIEEEKEKLVASQKIEEEERTLREERLAMVEEEDLFMKQFMERHESGQNISSEDYDRALVIRKDRSMPLNVTERSRKRTIEAYKQELLEKREVVNNYVMRKPPTTF